ncbi:hypothetical protein ACQP2K_35445 [Microbispora siamensis]
MVETDSGDGDAGPRFPRKSSRASKRGAIPPPPNSEDDNDWLQWLNTAGVCGKYGLVACGQVAAISAYAMMQTRGLKGNSNAQNSIRHFAWMAALYIVVGPAAAHDVGEAHEAGVGRKNYLDSVRDRYNNAIALQYAKDNMVSLSATYWFSAPGQGIPDLMNRLIDEGGSKYNAGQLAVLVKGNMVIGGKVVFHGS